MKNPDIVRQAWPPVGGDGEGWLKQCLTALEALDRVNYPYYYVLDATTRELLYDSPKPLWGESTASGYRCLIENIVEEERDLYNHLLQACRDASTNVPIERRINTYAIFSIHSFVGSGPIMINHKITPLTLTDGGTVRLVAIELTPSMHKQAGTLHFWNGEGYLEYDLTQQRWVTMHDNTFELTKEERRMLLLTAQGYTIDEIGASMFRAVDTVKKYRRSVFAKLGVDNIPSALYFALEYNLL